MKHKVEELLKMTLDNFFLAALGRYPQAALNCAQTMQAHGITTVQGLLRLDLEKMKDIFLRSHITGDVDINVRMKGIEELLIKYNAIAQPLTEKYIINFQDLANKEIELKEVYEIVVDHIKNVLAKLSDENVANQFQDYVKELFTPVAGGKLKWERDYAQMLKEVKEAPQRRIDEVKSDILNLISSNATDKMVKQTQASQKGVTATKK